MPKRTLRELAWSMLDELNDAHDGESLHPITYSDASRRAGVDPQDYARVTGQAASLIDAACFWAKLPFLAIGFVRHDDGSVNLASYSDGRYGQWHAHREPLLEGCLSYPWTRDHIEKIRRVLHDLPDGATTAWDQIAHRFGDSAITMAYEFAGKTR